MELEHNLKRSEPRGYTVHMNTEMMLRPFMEQIKMSLVCFREQRQEMRVECSVQQKEGDCVNTASVRAPGPKANPPST